MSGKSFLLKKFLFWLAGAFVLAGAYALYFKPAFMMRVADQIWACF